MSIAAVVFWACLFLAAYTFLLYPIVLLVAYLVAQAGRDIRYLVGRRDSRVRPLGDAELPSVSFIVPAHDEESHLPGKIANLHALDYPPERLEAIFVSDGSTDRTNEILRALADPARDEEARAPRSRCFFVARRSGKVNALNLAVAEARNDIVVMSDASTLFDRGAVKALVRHFADPTVGAVCGALRFHGNAEHRHTEGLYWTYESAMRLMEARLGATLTASGAIYALRRSAFRPLDSRVLIEDFVIPMNVRKQGLRVLYDPEATAADVPASSIAGEFRRRVRLALGSFLALGDLARIPFHLPTFVAFVSHKLLRWLLPFLSLGLLLSSAALRDRPFPRLVFALQLALYAWAALGFVFPRQLGRVRFGLLGYYLFATQLAFLIGFVRYLTGRHEAVWQRVT